MAFYLPTHWTIVMGLEIFVAHQMPDEAIPTQKTRVRFTVTAETCNAAAMGLLMRVQYAWLFILQFDRLIW